MKYNGIELTPIEEVQAFEEPIDMLTWCDGHNEPRITKVEAIIKKDGKYMPVYYARESLYTHDYCAEIPQAKQREMTSLEVMEYLWERNKSECVVVNTDSISWNLLGFHKLIEPYFGGYKFGIIKNGEVKEFELPKIEVINE